MSAISEIVYNNLKHSDDARNIVEKLFKNEIDSINGCVELNHFVKTIVRKYFKSAQLTLGIPRVGDNFVKVNDMVIFSYFDGDDHDFDIDLTKPINVYTCEDIPKDTEVIHLFTEEDNGYDMEFE